MKKQINDLKIKKFLAAKQSNKENVFIHSFLMEDNQLAEAYLYDGETFDFAKDEYIVWAQSLKEVAAHKLIIQKLSVYDTQRENFIGHVIKCKRVGTEYTKSKLMISVFVDDNGNRLSALADSRKYALVRIDEKYNNFLNSSDTDFEFESGNPIVPCKNDQNCSIRFSFPPLHIEGGKLILGIISKQGEYLARFIKKDEFEDEEPKEFVIRQNGFWRYSSVPVMTMAKKLEILQKNQPLEVDVLSATMFKTNERVYVGNGANVKGKEIEKWVCSCSCPLGLLTVFTDEPTWAGDKLLISFKMSSKRTIFSNVICKL